ncbi:MAG: nickel insertion protein, partial [Bacillota bacterium]
SEEDKYIDLIFKHTTTIGVRYSTLKRKMLERNITTVKSEFGEVRCKHSGSLGIQKSKLEHDDLVAIAEKTGYSLSKIKDIINKG